MSKKTKDDYNSDLNPLKYYGFAHDLDEDDERLELFRKQRDTVGFDDSETWNLNYSICMYILPRLKRIKEIGCVRPALIKEEKWDRYLSIMIKGLEAKTDANLRWEKGAEKVWDDGRKKLFAWFDALWW